MLVTKTRPIKIALVEDNNINTKTFHQKMDGFYDVEICVEALNGHDFLEKMKGLPLSQMPQVVFMDIEMPKMDGIQTTKIAKALYPQLQIIILTVFEDNDKIFEAIKSGAAGYLLKHETNTTLRQAISEVLEFGGAPMSPAIARKTLQLLSNAASPQVLTQAPMATHLSEREMQILKHTVNGWDAKRIAEQLDISVLTVRKHIANTYQKLHVNSKAQIISLAHHQKWFS